MGIRRGPNIIQEGLILSLDAGNVRSYPGSGTAVYDLSGRGNTGTLTNGATYNSTNRGTFSFDGTNDLLNLGNGLDTAFSHTAAWSIQFTFAISTFVNTYPGILVKGSASGTGVLLFYGNTGSLYWKHNNAQTFFLDMQFGKWYNIALTYTGSGSVLSYVNGSYVTTVGTMASTDSSSSLYIGQGDQAGNNLLGPLYKYNRVLSATEILQNFNMTKTRFGL